MPLVPDNRVAPRVDAAPSAGILATTSRAIAVNVSDTLMSCFADLRGHRQVTPSSRPRATNKFPRGRGRLQELDLVLGGERGALGARDAPLGLVVALVRHEHPIDLRVRVVRDLRHPAPHAIERPPVRDVVDEHDALRAPKIGPRDGPELLLARRVPDLQLHPPPVQIHGLDLEIDADRRDERRGEGVVRVAQQQRGLADGAVADHQQLDLQIKRPRRRHGRATRGNAPKE